MLDDANREIFLLDSAYATKFVSSGGNTICCKNTPGDSKQYWETLTFIYATRMETGNVQNVIGPALKLRQ